MNKKNLLIISDFDKTLTKPFDNGGKVLSSFELIRKTNFSKDYLKKAYALFDKYYPIENDLSLPDSYRKAMMEEWWTEQNKALIEAKFNKDILAKIISDSKGLFRDGALEFLDYLNENNIPILILSAGLGDIIRGMLEIEGRLYDNIKIIANFYTFDKEGFITGYKDKIIHVLNKSAHGYRTDKTDIMLLGDSVGDATMEDGLDYKNILKIGFLNDERFRKAFEEKFDVVLSNPKKWTYVKRLVDGFTS